jgi:hypothetical protein
MYREPDLIEAGQDVLRERLPEGWGVALEQAEPVAADTGIDASFLISSPDGQTVTVAVEAKTRFEPRDALATRSMAAQLPGLPLLIISPFLSVGTRERLLEADLNWIDLTGNTRLVLDRPGLFIATEGAKRRPGTAKRPSRSLKGVSAGRVVRALLATQLPINLSDLASRANVDPGYVSRVLELLDRSALIERKPRGPITAVDRSRLVRKWATDAPLTTRGEINTYLEPRGLDAFKRRLLEYEVEYALTGSLAAQRLAPTTSPRLAQVYVIRDPQRSAQQLELRPAEAGGNVQLICPRDRAIVNSRSEADDGLFYVKPVQALVDLLTSPGRGPAEGEELLRWMEGREDVWFE